MMAHMEGRAMDDVEGCRVLGQRMAAPSDMRGDRCTVIQRLSSLWYAQTTEA